MLEHQHRRIILVSHSLILILFFSVTCLFSGHCLAIQVELSLASHLDEIMSLRIKAVHELHLCVVARVYEYGSGCCSGLIGYLSQAKLWELLMLCD